MGALIERYRQVRALSLALTAGLTDEDQCLQSMADASPTKWHLAHTTWFFETFVLEPHEPEFAPHHPRYRYLFNSYYNTVGEQLPRPRRGLLSRPAVAEVRRYREAVDRRIEALLASSSGSAVARILEIGLNHEQQHQELLVTDIKHALAQNPLAPALVDPPLASSTAAAPESPAPFVTFEGGEHEIGHAGEGFCFDNERPRHTVLLRPFALASRPVTWGEYVQFMADGGYDDPALWLSDGWSWAQTEGARAPLYVQKDAASDARSYTLAGVRELDPAEPATHLSFYEADAFARWAGKRLPTEAEWEVAAAVTRAGEGGADLLDADRLHPRPVGGGDGIRGLIGGVWEWTASPYVGYPGYRPPAGAVGEYNGKFMCNQLVLRGGSCATPRGHVRISYRNFFPPDARWQFSGLRLADDP
jgi:ergothioneine biosynthesis protein EgtB